MPEAAEAQALFLESLPLVEEVVRIVSRRRGFSGDDAEEFGSTVNLRLVESNYRVFRRFRGGSTLRTYLITVIQRQALDYLINKTGKWRPSARAKRLGETAVRLEELLVRHRLSPHQAYETLMSRPDIDCSREQLAVLAAELPVRHRPRSVPADDYLERLPDPVTPQTQLEASDTRMAAGRLAEVLHEALARLPDEDRLLLRLRFESGLTVPQIGPVLGAHPKRLYKKIEWLLLGLRRALEEAGLAAGEIGLGEAARLLDLSFEGDAGWGIGEARPSTLKETDAHNGEGDE